MYVHACNMHSAILVVHVYMSVCVCATVHMCVCMSLDGRECAMLSKFFLIVNWHAHTLHVYSGFCLAFNVGKWVLPPMGLPSC